MARKMDEATKRPVRVERMLLSGKVPTGNKWAKVELF